MFYNCKNLRYLNIKNFVYNDNLYFQNLFKNIPQNLVICSQYEEINKYIHIKCLSNSCFNNWRKGRKIIYNDTCIESCKSINEYQYNDTCYDSCPDNNNITTIITSRENYCEKRCQKLNPFF